MTPKAIALTALTSIFMLASCGDSGQAAAPSSNKDALDYDVVAFTHTGDTLWHITANDRDDINSYSTHRSVTEKGTNLEFIAYEGVLISARPITPK